MGAEGIARGVELVWLAICLYWVVTWLHVKPVVRRERLGPRALQIFLLWCFAGLMFTRRQLPAFFELQVVPRAELWSLTGLALTALGAAIAIAARAYLGGNWSASVTIKEGHELIRTGPYALVRHPIYSGLLIAAAGTAVAFGQTRNLIALPILIAAFRLKQLNEERLLIETFGDQYRAYQQAVRSAMIPFLL